MDLENIEKHKKWFFISTIYTAKINDLEPAMQQHLVFLVSALDIASAREIGQKIAYLKELKYKNKIDEIVNWKFDSIVDVQELMESEIISGTEVYWSFSTPIVGNNG